MANIDKKKLRFIMRNLNKLYPKPPIPLLHRDAYTLLIAVLLSAQCTDKRVNKVTPLLFELADTPYKMAKVSVDKIRDIIKPCGLSPKKSRSISTLSLLLIERHNGDVPQTFEELEALPGVGHKTASVVMAQVFSIPSFPVDTHIHRLAQRWGLSDGSSVQKTEADLKHFFPKRKWNKLHLQIIYYAREYSPARGFNIKASPICLAIAESSF